MKKCLFIFITGLVLFHTPIIHAESSDENPSSFFEAVMEARNDSGLKESFRRIQELPFEKQEEVLVDCLRKMNSAERIPFEDESGEGNHDLSLVRGRCAWLAGKLLNIALPTMNTNTSKEQISEAKNIILTAIQKKQAEAAPSLAEIAEKPLNKRMELARSSETRVHVLSKLAMDENAKVRRAVAANVKTHPSVLLNLASSDEDPVVRETALENLERERTLEPIDPDGNV